MATNDPTVPWSRYDWGVDDKCPITGKRRKFGAWRVRLNRRLTPDEIDVVQRVFHAVDTGMTPFLFATCLPSDVKIIRHRDRLPLGKTGDDE